ncbi:MAG: hypothetical protein CL609_10920 [Anaerolineaceae bacterium]|nr:hypothetical protein [Anaerolineaceae bacterium]
MIGDISETCKNAGSLRKVDAEKTRLLHLMEFVLTDGVIAPEKEWMRIMNQTDLFALLPIGTEVRKITDGWRVSLKDNFFQESGYFVENKLDYALIGALKLYSRLAWEVSSQYCPWCYFRRRGGKFIHNDSCLFYQAQSSGASSRISSFCS